MKLNPSEFYLGQAYDLANKAAIPDKLIFYDPSDLTTHAVITGMTGSGKTGMGIILLEEAALQGIPAILIDPKGDLTNHLLHFPKLLPSDFAPWVDEDIARREGKTPEQAAAEAAENWQKGLARSGIDQARMQKLADNVDYAIYSPGSDSGFPVSILSSLKLLPFRGKKTRKSCARTSAALPPPCSNLSDIKTSTPFVRGNTSCSQISSRTPGARGTILTWNHSSCRFRPHLLRN